MSSSGVDPRMTVGERESLHSCLTRMMTAGGRKDSQDKGNSFQNFRIATPSFRRSKPRWHRWIAQSPPKGQVGGSNPLRGTITKY